MKFLDIVENGWASEDNPHRRGIYIRTGHRNGRMNPGKYYVVTDGKGDFWELPGDHEKLTITGNLLNQEKVTAAAATSPDTNIQSPEGSRLTSKGEQE